MHVRHHRLHEPSFTRERGNRRAPETAPVVPLGNAKGNGEVTLGNIPGAERLFLTVILASAGIFLVSWIGFLWMLAWLIPTVL
jgi:CHASE2 domain-containing sensor protein